MEQRHVEVFPGGYGRSAIYVGPHPPRIVSGSGIHVEDDRGNRLLDLSNNQTVLIHGHAHPGLVGEATSAVRDGTCFGLHNVHELPHAEALLSRIDAAEAVRYTNSGTEATLIALRIARELTGREKIVVVRGAFHGMAEPTLVAGGEASQRGIPAGVSRDSLMVGLNDVDELRRVAAEHGPEIAAFLIDLMPNQLGLVAAAPEFATEIRLLSRSAGSLLVVDEVISFRLAYGGLQSIYRLDPDLTLLGKLIGGGFPVGAVVGRREVMEILDPAHPGGLVHSGTFTANPVTMRVGLKALELLTPAEIDRINRLGDDLRNALRRGGIEKHRWTVRGSGSLTRLHPVGGTSPDSVRSYWWKAYERGVLLTPAGLASISTPMSSADVEVAASALLDAAQEANVEGRILA